MSARRWSVAVSSLAVPGVLAGAALFVVLFPGSAGAFSGGVSKYSGNPATGGETCTRCHSGGAVPSVSLTGPTSVPAGASGTYTLTISGGQQAGGGLDVSASGGAFVATDPGTRIQENEVTHESPRDADAAGVVSFTFEWRAPLGGGSYTLYGAGNSVDLNGGRSGDAAATATLAVEVTGGTPGPGEASAPALAPLTVPGYDPATGDMTLTYGVPCGATDHNIFYGPLDLVSGYGWTGTTCSIGATGAYSGFNPGPGSWFFVVVAHDGTRESSYGRDSSGMERPPAGFCAQQQDLATRCDLP
jgi:hypothetical protein